MAEPRVRFVFLEGTDKTIVFVNDFPLSAEADCRTAEKLARSLGCRYYTGKMYPADGTRPIKQFWPLEYPKGGGRWE